MWLAEEFASQILSDCIISLEYSLASAGPDDQLGEGHNTECIEYKLYMLLVNVASQNSSWCIQNRNNLRTCLFLVPSQEYNTVSQLLFFTTITEGRS